MRTKSIVLILIALGCGLVASIGISQVLERGKEPAAPKMETEQIYVAASNIDINAPLTADNVKREEWPKGKIGEGVVRNFEQLEGRFSRTRLFSGEPIMLSKLQDSSGGHSLKILPGYRVVPVKVTVDTISQALVEPGDRVDIIAYLRRSAEVPQTMTKTILRNVRVFAVNAQTERAVDEQGNERGVQTLSVLIKADQTEPLLLAMQLGQLRLSLRRPDDDGSEDGDGISTMDDLVSNGSEEADDKKDNGNQDSSGPSLLDLLAGTSADVPPVESAIALEQMQTIVMGPEGNIQTFTWTQDPGGLPDQIDNFSSFDDDEDMDEDDEVDEDEEDEDEEDSDSPSKG